MKKSLCAAAFLFAAALPCGRAARADDAGQPGQVDVDAMEKQYKNMPGGEAIVQQLEAHRAEIEAANKKAAAKSAAPGAADLSVPAKPAADVLALIPAPPKSVAEAKARLGAIYDGNGRLGGAQGDVKSNPAVLELMRMGVQAARAPMGGMGAMALSDDQREAMQTIGQDCPKIYQDALALAQGASRDLGGAKTALDAKLGAIRTVYFKKLDKACPDGEGTTAALRANCEPEKAAQRVELKAAREAYLADVAEKTAALRAAAADIVARFTKAKSAAAAFGKPAEWPMIAASPIMQADNGARMALGQLASASNDATVAASEKDPN